MAITLDPKEISTPSRTQATINRLVNQRRGRHYEEIEVDEFSPRMRERRRNLELFRKQAIFLLRISIRVGCRRVSIDYQKLGLPDEVVVALDEAKVSPPCMNIFDELVKRANKLEGLKKKIQSKYMIYSEPYWFVLEKDIETVRAMIQEMYATCDVLKQEALELYDQGLEIYLARISHILYSAGLNEGEVDEALPFYFDKFPTKEQVRNGFTVTVDWGGRVPSLVDQTKEDADLAEAEARRISALAAEEESQAVRQLQYDWIKGVRGAFSDALKGARNEVETLVSENLDVLQKMLSDDVQGQTKTKIKNNLERLETLIGFDSSLSDLVDVVNDLKQVQFGISTSSRLTLQQQIDSLRLQLIKNVRPAEGLGHRTKAVQGMIL